MANYDNKTLKMRRKHQEKEGKKESVGMGRRGGIRKEKFRNKGSHTRIKSQQSFG